MSTFPRQACQQRWKACSSDADNANNAGNANNSENADNADNADNEVIKGNSGSAENAIIGEKSNCSSGVLMFFGFLDFS